MTKFFFRFKNPYFWSFLAHFSNFGGKKGFSMKSICYAQLLQGFWHHAKTQKNLMIQFQENTQTDVKRPEWTDPISQDPSSYRQGSNKWNWSKLAFKSQRYTVQCWSYQKLLHHSQHAKNKLNS